MADFSSQHEVTKCGTEEEICALLVNMVGNIRVKKKKKKLYSVPYRAFVWLHGDNVWERALEIVKR